VNHKNTIMGILGTLSSLPVAGPILAALLALITGLLAGLPGGL
jgi:hypothetical protein